MFTGIKLYALIGIGVVVLALSGLVYVQRIQHQADVAELARQKGISADLTQSLRQSEADKESLTRRIAALDEALKAEHDLQTKLEAEKRALSQKLADIKPTLPAQDQTCFDRVLPDAVLGLLRDGPGNDLQDRNPESAGKSPDPVH